MNESSFRLHSNMFQNRCFYSEIMHALLENGLICALNVLIYVLLGLFIISSCFRRTYRREDRVDLTVSLSVQDSKVVLLEDLASHFSMRTQVSVHSWPLTSEREHALLLVEDCWNVFVYVRMLSPDCRTWSQTAPWQVRVSLNIITCLQSWTYINGLY